MLKIFKATFYREN